MAVYAVRDDVLARAGRFAGVFSVANKRPNLADLDAMLETVSASIDIEIRAAGYDPDLITADLAESLRDVAAWAVLLRALPEASPGSDEVEPTLERARQILTAAGFPGLAEGASDVFSAIEVLQTGAAGGGAGTSAGSFWDTLPEDELDEEAREPLWERGQSL